MFYSVEVLGKRGIFGAIWREGSAKNTLKKKEIQSCNGNTPCINIYIYLKIILYIYIYIISNIVMSLCDSILNSKQPLALRLSSTLYIYTYKFFTYSNSIVQFDYI